MAWFVTPQAKRLDLSDGQWIEVKRRLNTGDQQKLFGKMMPTITPGQPYALQSEYVLTAKVLAYLLDWSNPRKINPELCTPREREDAINNLDPDTFKEIREAIDAHEEAVQAEVDAAKKNPTGESTLKLASTSADG